MSRKVTVNIKGMTPEQRRTYRNTKREESRQRARARKEASRPTVQQRTEKQCGGCGEIKPLTKEFFYGAQGKTKFVFHARCKPCDIVKSSDWYVQHKFGLTREQYNKLVDGPCSICGTTDLKRVVDHCHARNIVRGALCNPCNHALGMMEDQPGLLEQAARYLRERGHG